MGLTEVSHEVMLLRKMDHAILLLPTVHKTQFDPVTFAVAEETHSEVVVFLHPK